jgi:hypothetical protein
MTVEELLGRYGIEVERFTLPRAFEPRDRPAGVKWGPSGSAGLRWPSTVVAEEDAGVQYVLHEGAHLITASKPQDVEDVAEEDGLMQLERAVARYLRASERRAVIDYQHITSLSFDHVGAMFRRHPRHGYAEVGDWRRPTRSRWWRNGIARAVALGRLTPDGRPTWKRRSA